MSIKYGEVGKTIYIDAGFNLNSAPYTELTIKFALAGQSFTRNTSDGVVAPNVPSPSIGGVSIPANTYAAYTISAADWGTPDGFGDIRGVTAGFDKWSVCLTYEDATPKKLFGDHASFDLYAGC